MKSIGERNWLKMSMHGKKVFLAHHNLDKKLATSKWDGLPVEIKAIYTQNPTVDAASITDDGHYGK